MKGKDAHPYMPTKNIPAAAKEAKKNGKWYHLLQTNNESISKELMRWHTKPHAFFKLFD